MTSVNEGTNYEVRNSVCGDGNTLYTLSSGEEGLEEIVDMKCMHKVTDFDYCQLTEVEQRKSTECGICRKEKKKRTKTFLKCNTCNISCCSLCYDAHRKNQMNLALRTFRRSCPQLFDISISKNGGFLEIKEFEDADNSRKTNYCPTKEVNEINIPEHETCAFDNKWYERTRDTVIKNAFLTDFFEKQKVICKEVLSCHDVKSAESLLKKTYGVSTEALLNEEEQFKCLYFQDCHMKDFFNFYPERLCIDASCALLALDISVMLFSCEDSNGKSEITAVSLLVRIDEGCLMWLFNTFKKHNPNWRKIKILAVDTHIANRDFIRNCFPYAFLVICLHHSVKEFNSDMTKEKLKTVPNDQKKIAINLFEGMIHAANEDQYNVIYQQFLMLHEDIVKYFVNKWHRNRSEWTINLLEHEDIFGALNDFLEYVENKLKPIINRQKNLCDFIKIFFFLLSLLRNERRMQIFNMLQMAPISLYSKFTPHYQVSKVLTPYAADFVIQQLDISVAVNSNEVMLSENFYFNDLNETVTTTASFCSCKFFTLTILPCSHMFAVRRAISISIFDETVCDFHWTVKYYQNTFESLQYPSFENEKNNVDDKTQEEDSKSLYEIVDQLFGILLQSSQSLFEQRIITVSKITSAWKENLEVYITFDGEELMLSDIEEEELVEAITGSPRCQMHSDIKYGKEAFISHDDSYYLRTKEGSDSIEEIICIQSNFSYIEWNFGPKLLECKMINFVYLSRVICQTKISCINWLQCMGFLPTYMNCPSCKNFMKHKNVAKLSDGVIWICKSYKGNKEVCHKKCSIRCGTWFESSNLSLEQMLMLTYMWIHNYEPQQVMIELELLSATYLIWDKFYRRVCEEVGKRGSCTITLKKALDKTKANDFALSPVEKWLKNNSEKDPFLQLLKDSAFVHEQDCAED